MAGFDKSPEELAERAAVELRSGPLFRNRNQDEGRFNPETFVTPGEELEDALMRSSMSAEEATMVRLVTSAYLANVCGVVMPLVDLRMFMLSTAARGGKATEHMRDVSIAAMAGAPPARGEQGAPAETRKGVLRRALGL